MIVVAIFLTAVIAMVGYFGHVIWRLHKLGIRIGQVHEYRMNMIDMIDAAAKEDLKNGIFNYSWRYDMFHKVTTEQMLYSREPLDSFYKNKSFLYPTNKPHHVIDVDSWEVVNMKDELNP